MSSLFRRAFPLDKADIFAELKERFCGDFPFVSALKRKNIMEYELVVRVQKKIVRNSRMKIR